MEQEADGEKLLFCEARAAQTGTGSTKPPLFIVGPGTTKVSLLNLEVTISPLNTALRQATDRRCFHQSRRLESTPVGE